MMFGSVSEHFANLRHVKRCKTCVSGPNALFRGTKDAKHPFYFIRTKMMIGSVSEHFANLQDVKRCKTCVREWKNYFGVPKLRVPKCTILGYKCCEASILLHWNQNDVRKCFRAFCKPSACRKMKNMCSHPIALFQGNKVVKHPF
jgi:hypothetical protein